MSENDLIERAAQWLDETSQSGLVGQARGIGALARRIPGASSSPMSVPKQNLGAGSAERSRLADAGAPIMRPRLRITRRSARTTAHRKLAGRRGGVPDHRCRRVRRSVAAILVIVPTHCLHPVWHYSRRKLHDRRRRAAGDQSQGRLAGNAQHRLLDRSGVLRCRARRALLRGQALFEVAKDRTRPFVVTANDRRLVAVGTAFDVRLDGARMQITHGGRHGSSRTRRARWSPIVNRMKRHRTLRARRCESPRSAPVSNSPSTTCSSTGFAAADPERATSWQRGQLLFDNTRLADAIAEMNRYSERQLELGDTALADLRISGAFSTSRPAVFVEAITMYFPIDVDYADEQKLTLIGRPSAVTPVTLRIVRLPRSRASYFSITRPIPRDAMGSQSQC